jgi:hypothetical protein
MDDEKDERASCGTSRDTAFEMFMMAVGRPVFKWTKGLRCGTDALACRVVAGAALPGLDDRSSLRFDLDDEPRGLPASAARLMRITPICHRRHKVT